MKKGFVFVLVLFFSSFSIVSTVHSRDLFTLHVQQGDIDQTTGFTSILDLFDAYKKDKLDGIIPGYDNTSAAAGIIDFRGIEMRVAFNDAGNMVLSIPVLGELRYYNGDSQSASFKMMTDDLKDDYGDLLKKLLKASISSTPYDMVAGNPSSLMSTMADTSFSRSGGGVDPRMLSYLSPNASRHTFTFQGEDLNATVFTLPIGDTWKLGGEESRWAILFDMPLSYTDLEGSKSYAMQIGLGLKIPLLKYWDVTPGVRVGAVGSEDMLSGGILYSGTLTSNVQVPMKDFDILDMWTFGMTNMAGIIRDYSIEVSGYDIDYDLSNQVYKNGVNAICEFNKNVKWQIGYSYTYYTGTDLYIDDYHEIDTTLAYLFDKKRIIPGIAIVGHYAFADDYKAYHIGATIPF